MGQENKAFRREIVLAMDPQVLDSGPKLSLDLERGRGLQSDGQMARGEEVFHASSFIFDFSAKMLPLPAISWYSPRNQEADSKAVLSSISI